MLVIWILASSFLKLIISKSRNRLRFEPWLKNNELFNRQRIGMRNTKRSHVLYQDILSSNKFFFNLDMNVTFLMTNNTSGPIDVLYVFTIGYHTPAFTMKLKFAEQKVARLNLIRLLVFCYFVGWHSLFIL